MTAEELSAEQKKLVMGIVEVQKPAHTKVIHYEWYAPFGRIGIDSTIGVDTKVGG